MVDIVSCNMYNRNMSLDEMTLRMEIAEGIKAISLGEDNAQLNAYGMQLLAIRVALGQND